jgi:purine-binding chemotaxis protein CheW
MSGISDETELRTSLRNADFSQLDVDEEEDTQEGRFLTFSLAEEDYGIGISSVREIVGMQKISCIPEMPPFIRGVINLRGVVIPVMDVRMRFHMACSEYDERTCIVVVNLDNTLVGLVVDRVKEVIKVREDDISKPPHVAKTESAKYILGIARVADTVKILLDVSRLLHEDEISVMSGTQLSFEENNLCAENAISAGNQS